MNQQSWPLIFLWLMALFGAGGCSLKATLDQTTDSVTNLTGTTSSARSWFTEDGQVQTSFKTEAFVSVNQESLRQDLARGQGEYLGSLAVLLGIPENQWAAFSSTTQARYAEVVERDPQDAVAFLESLQGVAEEFVQ